MKLQSISAELGKLQRKRNLSPDETRRAEDLIHQVEKASTEARADRILGKVTTTDKQYDNEWTAYNKKAEQRKLFVDSRQHIEERAGIGFTDEPEPSKNEYRGFGEFLQALACTSLSAGDRIGNFDTGKYYSRILKWGGPSPMQIRTATGLGSAQPSLGGFLGSEQMESSIFNKSYDDSQLLRRCRLLPLSGRAGTLKMNFVDESSRIDGSRHGGITSSWVGEGDTSTPASSKYGQIKLESRKIVVTAVCTNSLLQDSAGLGQHMYDLFSTEIRYAVDEAIFDGAGTNCPAGILGSNSLIQQAKESGQSAATIIAENLLGMSERMHPPSYNNARWFFNSDTISDLLSMTITVGEGGFRICDGDSTSKTILWRPGEILPMAKTKGSLGDVVFADFSQYLCASRGEMRFDVSAETPDKFLTDELVFRAVFKIDGQSLWNAAITPSEGSATQSPFIATAVREE